MRRILFFILLIGLIQLPLLTPGQSKENLREKIERNEKEIQTANEILNETKTSKKNTINELYVLQKRIDLRNDLIQNLNDQIGNIDHQIEVNREAVQKLQGDLEQLKQQYARIIYAAYKHHKGFSKLMFLLSSESFHQAYKRYKYLNQFAKYRRNQAEKIQVKTEKLKYKIKEFENLRENKQEILAQKTSEKYKLKYETRNVRDKIQDLKAKEEQIRQDIAQKKTVIAQLEEEIQKIIEEERRKTKAWKNLSAEHRELSASFEQNKGALPWPISNGIITREFGENNHPVLKGIKLNNNGVDISATENSRVRCIFNGVARKVVSIPGANLTVIVRHGNYLTVYSNLVDVNVEPGQRIATGEVIGQVYNDQTRNENVLHLEIYHENQKLNPEEWLK
jgi:septal ring factor EnvC (AmiA/AmiB activator)